MTHEIYSCDHPYYNKCTLIKMNDRGIAVIQQRFNPSRKWTWWGPIDVNLVEAILENDRFPEYFAEHAAGCRDGLYPTVTIRQIMWALKMRALPKQKWETRFY